MGQVFLRNKILYVLGRYFLFSLEVLGRDVIEVYIKVIQFVVGLSDLRLFGMIEKEREREMVIEMGEEREERRDREIDRNKE